VGGGKRVVSWKILIDLWSEKVMNLYRVEVNKLKSKQY